VDTVSVVVVVVVHTLSHFCLVIVTGTFWQACSIAKWIANANQQPALITCAIAADDLQLIVLVCVCALLEVKNGMIVLHFLYCAFTCSSQRSRTAVCQAELVLLLAR
jgi:hypothetical protein